MTAIVFEARDDSIILVHFNATPNDAQFQAYLAELDRRVQASASFGVICQVEGDARLEPEHRRRVAAWMNRNAALLQARCWATVFVISSPIARLVLASLMALQRTPLRYKVVGTRQDALAFMATARS